MWLSIGLAAIAFALIADGLIYAAYAWRASIGRFCCEVAAAILWLLIFTVVRGLWLCCAAVRVSLLCGVAAMVP